MNKMNKNEKKREWKARNRITTKILKYPGGKWLSNVSKKDAKKIKKTFPQVIEGPPRGTDCESVEELIACNIIGLYSPKKQDEVC